MQISKSYMQGNGNSWQDHPSRIAWAVVARLGSIFDFEPPPPPPQDLKYPTLSLCP